jgi:anti-sigma regulatory factor (Ser/Thr protein kinase)
VGGSVRHGLDGAQLDECQRHERILNVAFPGDPFLLLCPYDATALGEDTLDLARESHPLVLESGRSRISDAYQPDQLLDSLFIGPLTAPTGAVTERRFDRYGLAGLRRFVADRAVAGGAGDRCDDLVLATSEIATNIVTHGGDEGEVRCWTDGDWMVCELEGSGTITDPLAGRLRPDPAQPGGRGLWLANQLCDLVQVRNTGMGSVVRLRVRSSTGPA